MEFIVSVYLKGFELDPDLISKIVGIQPTRSQKTGELCFSSKTAIAKTGFWALIAQTCESNLDAQIEELLRKLENSPKDLDKISGVQELYLDILAIKDEDEFKSSSIFLNGKYLDEIRQFGLNIQFTVS